MESTAKLREINDLITVLEERNKAIDQEKAENTTQIEKLKEMKSEECFRLLESAKPGEKSVKVEGLTITKVSTKVYKGVDLDSRLFAKERSDFRKNEAEALRRKADQIEKGEEKISESKLLKYLLSIATGLKKLEKYEEIVESVRVRGL